MKRLLVLASLLLSTFSAHATTVVAEDTAEHTIQFTFGRPSADVYLCEINLYNPYYSELDTMTFPNGDTINGNSMGGNNIKHFTPETAPANSTLHLGSADYGTMVSVIFCHDLRVPEENTGGQVDTFYKIVTPSSWSYFSNAGIKASVNASCPAYGVNVYTGDFDITSNAATDYTLITSTPFSAGSVIASNPSSCITGFQFTETASGPRPANETAGNITVGVKDQINFN